MTRKVVSPIALDKSINTTEQTPRNIADVLAQQLAAIKTAIESGNGNLEAAFVCYYGVTTATQIKEAIEDGKVPYFYYNGAVAQLWKVETDKYTFRTTNTRSVEGQTILDVVDYVVNGSVWSTITREVSGGSSSGQSYIASVSSSANFDTTGHSGMHSVLSVNNVPADGIYQLSVMLHITPKTSSATKSDLVFGFYGADGIGMADHTFHAIVDDSQTFAQQLSFSTTINLKAGANSLKLSCDALNTDYLVFVDDLTVAQIVNGSSSGGGGGTIVAGTIYPTLQDAIADADNLAVGNLFETNGFHTSGDGGAARYLVSTTGTANGMDIVQLAAGKLAIAQLKGSAYTEQIGYEVSSAQADVTPYIKRLLALGIQEVKFYPTGGAPTRCYCIRDTLDLDRADYHNVGVHLKGADIGGTSGYFTWFNFQPSVSNTDKIAIKIHSRTTEIENIALMYGDGMSNASNRGSSAGICFDSTGNTSYQTSSYGAVLKNLVIHGFNSAILSKGDSPYIWHVDFEKITFASNNTHVSLDGLSYCTKFRNCLFNSPDVQSIYLGEPFTTSFDSCNFGIDDRGTAIIRSSEWVVPSAPVDEKRGMTLFINCNFEVEYRGSAVPQDNHHLFIYADDNSQIDFEFDNCSFIYTPLTRENVFTDRMFSLGSGCSAIIRNSIGPYSDVNYTGNEFYGKDFDKYFFDENRPPRKKVGSVILQHCEGINPFPFLDDAHLPCFKKDEDVILCSDTTGLDAFERIEDGTILFNLDRHVPIVKIADNFVDCASAPSGVVRIGNELYNYVVIDGLKWITRNLNLRIPTRQHTIFDHLEWGQYYKYSDLSAIQAKLPSGWRIPNASDISSIKGDGSSTRAHNLQSLGVSYWTDATNSTGFSALPSTWWYKPNTTPHSTFKQYAFYWTTATEGSAVKNISIAPNAVSSGGWSASEAASLWIPIRVCADA
jgi:uncharacterized protein (TIGR02145 family)